MAIFFIFLQILRHFKKHSTFTVISASSEKLFKNLRKKNDELNFATTGNLGAKILTVPGRMSKGSVWDSFE